MASSDPFPSLDRRVGRNLLDVYSGSALALIRLPRVSVGRAGIEDPVSIGDDVAVARRAAGLTIEDVSEATRVRATVLRRIEQDDFSLCGGDVYARGHLRAICSVVGLDPVPLLRAFDAEYAVTASAVATGVIADEAEQEHRRVNWTAVMSVALVAILAFATIRLVTVDRGGASRSSSPPIAAASPTPSLPTTSNPSTSPAPTPSGAASVPTGPPSASLPTDAVAAGPAVQVVMTTTTGRSWVQVTGSKGVVFSGILEKGVSRRFADTDKISLVVGNAGSVSLTVNGQDLGTAGTQGQVARLSFGPGNPAQG